MASVLSRASRLWVVGSVLVLGTVPGCKIVEEMKTGPRPRHVIEKQAEQAFAEGRYEVAAADYEEILERKPDEVWARYELGRTYLAMNQPIKAREQLVVAYDVDPSNEKVIDALAQSYYDAKEYDKLTGFLRRLASERGTVKDHIRLGQYATKIGNPDEGVMALKNAAALDGGKTIEPQIALADFYKLHKDRANEVRRLRMALFVEPKNKVVMSRLLELGQVPGPSLALMPNEY